MVKNMQKKQFHCFYVFLLLWSFIAVSAQNLQQANDAFEQQQWVQALQLYRHVAHKDSMIWQNIGTCYLQLQQYSQALLCLKRSYIGIHYFQVPTVLQSEAVIMQQLSLPAVSKFQGLYQKFLLMVPMIPLKLLFLSLLLYIGILLLGILGHNRTSNVRIFFGILLCFMLAGIWHSYATLVSSNNAIIMQKNIVLYAGPQKSFHVLHEAVQQGSLVKVLQYQQGMYQIEQQDICGWVEENSIELIYKYE